MKHKAFRWIPAVLLAALLAGCGAKTAASARPASSRELKSTPPDSMHATAAITEQYTLEKVVQAENGGKVRLNIHLPRLESDSADAARINAEIARYYEYDVQEYADCPEAADPESWDICIEMNWNASWYGDRLLHPGNIRQPADPVRCRDPHRRAECRRCDRLGRGKKSGLEPDMPQRGRQKPLDHLHDGGRLTADAVHRPQKGQ